MTGKNRGRFAGCFQKKYVFTKAKTDTENERFWMYLLLKSPSLKGTGTGFCVPMLGIGIAVYNSCRWFQLLHVLDFSSPNKW